ncbi:MAG TPA: hypothetical protein VG871_13790, partial [Vicinamibacterales bacterium]|nr:hypothetical protein [Vicinamibacterales bacterium]
RIAQSAHLSVLSAEWMPLALYGMRRYFDSVTTRSVDRLVGGRVRPLAGAAAAVVLQALSSGDFLFYFTPFAALAVFWEIGRRRQWANLRMWAQLAVAAAAATVVIVPFVLPYVVLHDVFHLIRPQGEVQRGAADVYSYATAMAAQPLWGRLASAWPNPGVELFPGLVPLLLAVVGVVAWRDLPVERDARSRPETHPRIRRTAAVLLGAAAIVHAAAFAAVLLGRHLAIDAGLFVIHLSNANQMLLRSLIALVLLCVVSAGARQRAARFVHAHGFLVVALAAALWLSLGVAPQSLGRPIELFAPYGVLYRHVGGFDALAVPARYGILVALMLAVLGGCGAAVLARRRATRVLLAALAVLFVAEATVLPFPVNRTDAPHDLAMPQASVSRPARAPAIYAQVAQLPQGSVLAELPLGDPVYDQRAVFYSIVHWRPILNGTGDFLPPHYADLTLALSDVPRHPAIALDALHRLGATHVLVHEAAFLGDEGPRTSAALRAAGGREVFRDGGDALFVLSR